MGQAGLNAMLKAHHGCETWIPPGDAALVDTWDEDRLSYRRTGHPLPAAIANALVFAWAISVTFPLLSG